MPSYLSNLHAPEGSNTNKRRLGRGVGSGLGKTAGKGQKGQKARHPGNFGKLGYQGGQTPIQRRLPKRGFRNPFAVDTAAVNIDTVARRFAKGAMIDLAALQEVGVVGRSAVRVKILGNGEVPHALNFKVHAISAGARAKVEKAGGKVDLIEEKKSATEAAAQ